MHSDPAAPPRRRRGPTDHQRRDRITKAVITVVAEHGVEKLTHRRVAAAAGVPLGSTTYHFATLDDLLDAAMTMAAQRSVAQLRSWAEALDAEADLSSALAAFVVRSTTETRGDTMAEYNLYALALHRPRLRDAAAAWDQALAEVLAARTDPTTGRMLGVLLCGLLMQVVLKQAPPTTPDIEALIRRAIDGKEPVRAG